MLFMDSSMKLDSLIRLIVRETYKNAFDLQVQIMTDVESSRRTLLPRIDLSPLPLSFRRRPAFCMTINKTQINILAIYGIDYPSQSSAMGDDVAFSPAKFLKKCTDLMSIWSL